MHFDGHEMRVFAALRVGCAMAVGLLAPKSASAEDNLGASADLRFIWMPTAPTLTHVSGFTLLDVAQPTDPIYAVAFHADLTSRQGPFVLQPIGVGIGVGGGGYGGASDPGFHKDGPAWIVSLDFVGVGVGDSGRTWRFMLSLGPALDFIDLAGHRVVNGVNVDASGNGPSFALRSRAEICLRKDGQAPWLCILGGPTLLQGETWLDGGYVGVGTML